MTTVAELWETETPAAKPATGMTPAKQQGVSDLQTFVDQAQRRLKDTIPGSDTHKRLTRELANAQKALGDYGAPQKAAGNTIADLWEATPTSAAAPTAAQAAQIPGAPPVAAPPAEQQPLTGVAGVLSNIFGPAAKIWEQRGPYLKGAGEAAIKLAEQGIAYPLSAAYGVLRGGSEEEAAKARQALSGYQVGPEGQQILEAIGKGAEALKIPALTPELAALPAAAQVKPTAVPRAKAVMAEWKAQLTPAEAQAQFAAKAPGGSVGAMATPNEAVISQALSVVSPELKAEISNIPVNKVNLPTLQRHIEADTLPTPVRLTEGQATGDVVKLSKEQNRRGQDLALAQRFNEQNGQLIDNLEKFKERTSPDAYGSRTMDNAQGIIDSYKSLDRKLTTDIDNKYQALRDAAGGEFPVDAPTLLKNVESSLKKQLLSNDAPPSQFKELQRLADSNAMTFEDFLSLRRNLGQVARTSTDGNVRTAAGLMIKELEKLPLQEGAKQLKPLADEARIAARNRFQMLEKDPAYRAVVDDSVPSEKFFDKFVINGHNKNVQTMLNHLADDPVARQHMAAGTINYLRDRAGIVDNQGNFSQAGYNKALKFLDDSNKMPLIFDGETATGLKTLGNVARYTQAQPRGAFVNNSNTLVGALAQRAGATVGRAVESGLNVAVPGVQLGTSLMEMRARRAAEKETQKSLKPGAGIANE